MSELGPQQTSVTLVCTFYSKNLGHIIEFTKIMIIHVVLEGFNHVLIQAKLYSMYSTNWSAVMYSMYIRNWQQENALLGSGLNLGAIFGHCSPQDYLSSF